MRANGRYYDGVDFTCAFFIFSTIFLVLIKFNFYNELSWWIVTLPVWAPTFIVGSAVLYFSGMTKLSELAKREYKIKNNGN